MNLDDYVEQETMKEREREKQKMKTKTNLGRWVGWSIGYAITDEKSRTLATGHSR